MRTPDFSNLLAVLNRQRPSRPTLFEFFLNRRLYAHLAGTPESADMGQWGSAQWSLIVAKAYERAGYDYVTMYASDLGFPSRPVAAGKSHSMNDTAVITDRPSFESYAWADPDRTDFSRLDTVAATLHPGMKIIAFGPGGVLENAIALVGYEPLCLLLLDDEPLAAEIFAAIGSRLLRYYQRAVTHPAVGAIISNDDWGFHTQLMLPPDMLRKYVFPWHRQIAAAAHALGKPAILHSCGQLEAVMEDIIVDLKYDGKHSYEDKICPVEQMYDRYHKRIAILGGLDLDFVCRKSPAEIRARAQAMLDRSRDLGSYALGTGNSVPDYVPDENYFAMIEPAVGRI